MERLWTKSFVGLSAAMLFLFTGFYFLLPTLPLYLQELGGSESQIGLATGAFTLAAVLFRPFAGGLMDRFGRRPFMLWGLAFFILFMCLYDWIGGIFMLVVLRFLHGASWAFSTTAVSTSITDIVPPARRGEGMGWFGMAMTAAMAVGPLIGLSIVESLSFSELFRFAAGFAAVALLLAFAVRIPFRPAAGNRKMVVAEKSVLPVAAAVFFLTVSYGGITTFLPLFSETIGVNSGTFFLVYAIALALTRPVAGKLSDSRGEAAVILPALAITALALLNLSFASGLPGVIVSAVLYAVGFGSAHSALQAANLRLANPQRLGAANATFFTAFDLGIGLGSIVLGLVSQLAGYEVLFAVCAGSTGLAAVMFGVFAKRPLQRRRAEDALREPAGKVL
ncbi:MFS transporter [Cohnella algarum]|uniref:MFS transporter n=1 Tax=Cohnella algarum TaxID=2044859 RepID=UPI0019687C94|nr:MFS transporter [Cohnella algarum]MBN2983075.1 MFS transporter [Cohnella algarum]